MIGRSRLYRILKYFAQTPIRGERGGIHRQKLKRATTDLFPFRERYSIFLISDATQLFASLWNILACSLLAQACILFTFIYTFSMGVIRARLDNVNEMRAVAGAQIIYKRIVRKFIVINFPSIFLLQGSRMENLRMETLMFLRNSVCNNCLIIFFVT